MVEELIGAIAQKLRDRFGNEYRVYTEGVYQFAEKPCFFIECEGIERVPLTGNRYYLRVTVKVTAEIDGDEKKYKAQRASGDVFSQMNSVEVNSFILQGRKIHGKWEDGNLVIRGCYDIFTKQEEESERAMMETVEGGVRIDD